MRLVGFSQGVSLSSPKETQNYLEFVKDDGKPFRLPVPEETMQALLAEVYQQGGHAPSNGTTKPVEEETEPDATQFGGGEEEPQFAPEPEEPQSPRSEGEVPSL